MTVTWKKWLIFLSLAIALLLVCQLYAQRYLFDLEAFVWPLWHMSICQSTYSLSGEAPAKWAEPWYVSVNESVSALAYAPWPVADPFDPRKVRHVDPNSPQTDDPETIMGLAIASLPEFGIAPLVYGVNEGEEAAISRFDQLSKLALSLAVEPQRQRRLERILLYVESTLGPHHEGYWRPRLAQDVEEGRAASRPGGTVSRAGEDPQDVSSDTECSRVDLEDYVWNRALAIDPDNLLYRYRRVRCEIDRLVEPNERPDYSGELLPSEGAAQTYRLVCPEELASRARRIGQLLECPSDHCTLTTYPGYIAYLLAKGLRFAWSGIFWGDLADDPRTAIAYSTYHVSPVVEWRETIRMLCFVGSQLAEREHDGLALDIYGHAYALAQRGLTDEGDATPVIQYLSATACANLTASYLSEFWATRRDARKVMAIQHYREGSSDHFAQLRRKLEQPRSHPWVGGDMEFGAYLRSAGFTWWCGQTGMVLLIGSLASGAWYAVCRRRLGGKTLTLGASRRTVVPAILGGILAALWLGLLIPLDLSDPQRAETVAAWAAVLTSVCVIAVGLLARRAVGSGPDGPRPSAGWLWPAIAVAGVAAAIVATFVAERTMAAAPAVAGCAVVVGLVVWASITVVTGFRRRTPGDRAYRAQVTKTFAVCAMFGAVIWLLLALGSMSLTRVRQRTYFAQVNDTLRREICYYLGDDWPASYRPLPPEVFELDDAATRPVTPAQD